MNITKITLSKLRIPLIRPFITALRRAEYIEDIVVSIECANGLIGFGSAAPTPVITGDTQESIVSAITEAIAPKLLGKSLDNFEELLLTVQTSLINNPSAKAAVDIALHDLVAQYFKVPLYQFLGGSQKPLKIVSTVSVKEIAEMVADAKLFAQQGFTTLKIKVGQDQAQDLARVKAIRQAVGKSVQLILDANQGWEVKTALQLLEAFNEHALDITMVEQPIIASDYTNLKYLRDNASLPIYADESVFNLQDAARVITGQIADGINIKLMKSGGLYQAHSMYRLATAYNVPCMVGCMLESPIGLAAMASFAVGRSNISFIDLDPITMIKTNPVQGGVQLKNTLLYLTDAPGLGIKKIDGLEPVVTLQQKK